jgi:hypothetical protein
VSLLWTQIREPLQWELLTTLSLALLSPQHWVDERGTVGVHWVDERGTVGVHWVDERGTVGVHWVDERGTVGVHWVDESVY